MSLIDKLFQIPTENRLEAAKALHKEFFTNSLYHTCKYLLGYQLVNWRTHGNIIHSLQGPRLRKLEVMPRGTFKTSIAAVGFSIFLLNRDPNLTILLDSELYNNSKNTLREIKQHMEGPKLTKVFGEYRKEPWNEAEITIRQRTQIRKEASITCSGIGAQKTGQHYDVIIADDMNSPKNSNSPEGLQKVIDHYRMYTSILNPGGIIVVVGTRYSAGDLIGFILANEVEAQATGLLIS